MVIINEERAHKIMRKILALESQHLENNKYGDEEGSDPRPNVVKNIRKILEEEIDAIKID